MRFRLELDVNVPDGIDTTGKLIDTLGRISEQLAVRHGHGSPLGFNIDRAVVAPTDTLLPEGTVLGRYAIVEGAAWQPDQGRAYRYETACEVMRSALADLETIAGDRAGMSGASWQDHAGTAAIALRELAGMLDSARQGRVIEGPVVFPSIEEELENSRKLHHT